MVGRVMVVVRVVVVAAEEVEVWQNHHGMYREACSVYMKK